MFRSSDINRDRLYLSQGAENIYIDTCKIPPHHVEGIRFLFRQWKRKRPGVIINDVFSYGRNIQIVLFLKAVLPLLNKPVLVLCQDGDDHVWSDRFNTWGDLFDEVVIERENPAVKKMIIVNTMLNMHQFCRREWSVLIVDGDNDFYANKVLTMPFSADFKIWNTPVNMKENLDKFADIFKWLYPNEIFCKENFIPNSDSAVDLIERSILLESFMDDIVIRRDDLESSFQKYQREMGEDELQVNTASVINIDIPLPPTNYEIRTVTEMLPPPPATTLPPLPLPTVSRKNKDATGTKIKRSKRKTEEQESIVGGPATASEQPKEVSTAPPAVIDITKDFSIDNYKRKIQQEDSDIFVKKSHSSQLVDTDDKKSSMKLYYSPDSEPKGDNLLEMDTLAFGNDLLIRKVNAKGGKPSTCAKPDIATEPDKVLVFKPRSEQITSTVTGMNPPKTSLDKISTGVSLDTIRAELSTEALNRKTSHLKLDDLPSEEEKKYDTDSSDDEPTKKFKRIKYSSDFVRKKSTEEKKVSKKHHINVFKSHGRTVKVNCDLKVKTNDPNIATTASGTNRITKQVKRTNIEEKMKECEQKVSKKFKGSVLDRLF